MDIYYVNHLNKKTDFMNGNYNVEESSIFSHEWDYDAQKLPKYGEKIKRLKKNAQKPFLTLHIEASGLISCEQAYNELISMIEVDTLDELPGRLYVDDFYMNCFIILNEPVYFVPGAGSISCKLGLLAPVPFWIQEQLVSIRPISSVAAVSEETATKKYPYTYPYRYPLLQTETTVNVDHFTESDFQMKVYGPATSVHIYIAGHPYIVHYPLEAGEYMVIDSRPVEMDKKLYVVKANGDTVNIFHYRDTENSVFKKIPSGQIKIDYSRSYGVDLTIFKERSEPLWNSLQ